MITLHTASVTSGMGEERFNAPYLWRIALIAAMGGLLFGYDWVVIGGAKPFYELYFHLSTPAQQGWAMSCALAGCLSGALTSGFLSDRFGRKRLLSLVAAIFAITSLGTGMAQTFTWFVAWRIAGGIAIGLASSLSPMYIAEIAPEQIRGRLVSVNQMTIVLGIVFAQVVNWAIAKPVPPAATSLEILHSWNGQLGWRWMFGVTAIPAVLFFMAMFFVSESPRWLMKRGMRQPAASVLRRIGGEAYAARVRAEIELSIEERHGKNNLSQLLRPPVLKPVLLGVALAVLQQWCGINVIFNYAQEVFTAAGYTLSGILFNIVVTGLVMFVFTFAAIALVDRQGRRILMMSGCAGLAILYTGLGYAYYTHSSGWQVLLLVVASIACYSMTLAPVTWVILSEIFPNKVRGAAMSVATTALWTACFILTYTFPLLNSHFGSAKTFWIYAGICAAGLVLVTTAEPETKGLTLEQIERLWQ
jgi:SP family arabinose:H+ symporter-like MFS transporter